MSEKSETARGTAGASQLVPGTSPCACPHTPPGMQAVTAGGSLFKITDSSRLSLLRFCFVQRRNRPGTWLSKSTEEVSWGKLNMGINVAPNTRTGSGYLLWTQQQLLCGLPTKILLRATVLLCCLGASRQGFLLPTCACTQGLGDSLFKGTRHL